MEDRAIIKQNHVLKIKTEEISRGYTVFENPTIDFLPADFQADLLVVKGQDNYVHVVQNRVMLATNTESLGQAAEILRNRDHWQFVLNLVGEPESVTVPANVTPSEIEKIYTRLTRTMQLDEKGLDSEAVFIMCWSACEALIRLILIDEGEYEINRPVVSEYLIGILQSMYIFTDEDINLLKYMVKINNVLAHGFDDADFSEDDVTTMMAMCDALVCYFNRDLDPEEDPDEPYSVFGHIIDAMPGGD